MKQILIVDDSHVSVRLFTALLESPDFQVRGAFSGVELREVVAAFVR